MQYNIEGGMFPILEVSLSPGESIITQNGGMIWMSPNLKMETKSGGVGKAFSKMFSGEKMFQNIYTAEGGAGFITIAPTFAGTVLAFDITPDKPLIVQKTGFLASSTGVELSIFLNKNLGAGFFGGEGFIMQKISGNGQAFIEIDGYCKEYVLAKGQQIVVDTGNVAALEASCTMEIQRIKGAKNVLLGGEGLFNTVLTGPGKVYLQSHPLSTLAESMRPYMRVSG